MRANVHFYIENALRAHKDSEIKLNDKPIPNDGSSKIIHYYVIPEDTNVRNPQCIKLSRNEAIEEAIEYIKYLEAQVKKEVDIELLLLVLRSTLSPDEYDRFMKNVEQINQAYNRLAKEILKR